MSLSQRGAGNTWSCVPTSRRVHTTWSEQIDDSL